MQSTLLWKPVGMKVNKCLFTLRRKKEPPPFDLTILKGEIHGLFSRRFVEYIVESPQAQGFLRWCWNTSHASEHYWNTLNYNRKLNVPGGYYGIFPYVFVDGHLLLCYNRIVTNDVIFSSIFFR